MVHDAEIRVREVLALYPEGQPKMIPHDVAVSLAHDAKRVSVSLLQTSDVLTDMDLIEIIHGRTDPDILKAIAGRCSVSSGVADELAQKKCGCCCKPCRKRRC